MRKIFVLFILFLWPLSSLAATHFPQAFKLIPRASNGNGNPGHTHPYCGDGIVQLNLGEECDDGNAVDGDGCSVNCTKEQENEPTCGNGILESGEDCDDGNTVDGDGCSARCKKEESHSPICGNGILETGEDCDDGNGLDGDGCSSTCELEICGDGVLNAGEGCDDGNLVDGDGCNALCLLESCGDGIVQSNLGEECESGVTILADHYSCGTTCLVEVEPYCGDGNLDSGEACDDGNGTPNDGCDATCALEGVCDEDSIQVCGSDVGECAQGTLVCEEDGEWSTTCEGEETSTDEVCDGADNNCDGVVDDNLQQGCSNSCGDAGVMICTNGEWSECSAAETNCSGLSLPPPEEEETPAQDETTNSCKLLGISSIEDLPVMGASYSLAFAQGETVTVTTDDGVLVDVVPLMNENGMYTGFVTVQNCLTSSVDSIFQGETSCSLNTEASTPISWMIFILLVFVSLSPRTVYHFIKRH